LKVAFACKANDILKSLLTCDIAYETLEGSVCAVTKKSNECITVVVSKEKLHSLKLVEQRLDQALLFNLKTTANQAAPSGNLEKGNHFPDNGRSHCL